MTRIGFCSENRDEVSSRLHRHSYSLTCNPVIQVLLPTFGPRTMPCSIRPHLPGPEACCSICALICSSPQKWSHHPGVSHTGASSRLLSSRLNSWQKPGQKTFPCDPYCLQFPVTRNNTIFPRSPQGRESSLLSLSALLEKLNALP